MTNEEKVLLDDKTKSKSVSFTITISGTGNDLQEAWIDAVQGFTMDCGQEDEDDVTSVEAEDDDE